MTGQTPSITSRSLGSPGLSSMLPVCCPPEAFTAMTEAAPLLDRFSRRPQDNSALTAAALAVGRIATGDELSMAQATAGVEKRVAFIADRVRRNLHSENPRAILAHLHQVMFDDFGFLGEPEDYLDPTASDLLTVMQTGHGLPVVMSLAYKLVAEKLGLSVHGLGLAGHFVVTVDVLPLSGQKIRPQRIMIDPYFGGQVLHAEEAFARVAGIVGLDANDLIAEGDPLVAETQQSLLKPVTRLHWITRTIQNLLNLFTARDQWGELAALLELEIALWPGQVQLQRDLALVLARGNHPRQASAWLASYLAGNPDDPQYEDLRQLLKVLKP